ncbi:MAG: HAMP domain-containing histidine kinase [Thiovulaceae bacterium]|nr:HAMP domain-containing histidine kinase [Sulfurimonadaceae bacterium]
MSVSNVTGINLKHSEFRSLRAFLLLYALLTLFIIALLAYSYFTVEKERMLSQWRLDLQLNNESFLPELKQLHNAIHKTQNYPKDTKFQSAIYDIDKKRIFSTLHAPTLDLNRVISLNDGYIQAVFQPEFYYLGAKYIVLEVADDGLWRKNALQNILLFGTIFFLFMVIVGWYLAKLFLRPMRQALALLNRFIKDTTHELNTPVAAILNNIETIDGQDLDDKTAKKITRIKIATRTISTLYEDLSFLILHHKVARSVERINLSKLLHERIIYFELHLKQKHLSLETKIEDDVYKSLDRQQAIRIFDNLLSNAIKYNKINGSVRVTLDHDTFCVSDTGKGMTKEEVAQIFERYARFDSVQGGFGIGLNIVSIILKEYGFTITVNSTPKEGSTFTISW